MKFIIAAVQMCSSGFMADNLSTARRLIALAAKQGAKMIVLPEMFPVFGSAEEKLSVKEPIGSGPIQDFLSQQAGEHDIWIVGGTIPIAEPGSEKAYAACLVYDNHGRLFSRYDKIHLFDVSLDEGNTYRESDTTIPGKNIVIVNTPFGKMGLSVCYDLRFPDMFRKMLREGVDFIVSPSAFTVPTGQAHWHLLLRSTAIQTFSYVIGACQGGKHENGRETYGHTMIVDPWGKVLNEVIGDGENLVLAEIDTDYAKACKRKIPTRQHQPCTSLSYQLQCGL